MAQKEEPMPIPAAIRYRSSMKRRVSDEDPTNEQTNKEMENKVKYLSNLLPLLLTLSLIQGCGGGGSTSSTYYTFRLVNGTSATLDMVTGGTVLASEVAYGTASSYVNLTSGTYVIALENSGTGIPSVQINSSFSTATPYTLFAYKSSQNLYIAQLIENETAPSSGYGKIRIADLSSDAGNVDVYMSTDNIPANDVYIPNVPSPALSAATRLLQTGYGTSSYFQIPKNTYHIWVTGAGDTTDLRLDIPSIVISDQQILTLVLTSTTGGVLVDGMLVTQQGGVVPQVNTNSRIRIVANTTTDITSATAANISLLDGATSFNSAVGSYILVPSGSSTIPLSSSVIPLNITSGTTLPTCTNPNAIQGEDLTLLLTEATCTVFNDDNTRPIGSYAKLRLVNGINGGSNISLFDNSQLIASNVALGEASVPTANGNQGIVSTYYLSNLSVSPTTPAYSALNVSLLSQGIYSLFMMGSSTASTGILSRDH
jgi:hypothetical protein